MPESHRLAPAIGLLLLACPLIAAHAAGHADSQVGIGLSSMPVFAGSSDARLRVVPLVNIDLAWPAYYIGGRYGGGPLQVGARTMQGAWTFGAGISYAALAPRDASPENRLHGLPGIDRTAWAGAFVAYDHRLLHAWLRWDHDVLGKGQGGTLTLDIRQAIPLGERFALSLGPRVVWGDQAHLQTSFGISPSTASATGLPAHETSAGLQESSFGIGLRFQATPSWVLGAELRAARLSAALDDSPVVETRSQSMGTVFALYRF